MDSVVDLKSKYSGLTPRLLDSPLYPNRMAIERGMAGLDPTWTDNSFDPKRTMDFALFGKVCYGFVLPSVTRESVERTVKLSEHDDVPELPPLEVILYNDIVRATWGWDRLLPWTSGSLLFEDYFGYLEQYYSRNEHTVFKYFGLRVDDDSRRLIAAAAKECAETEKELNAKIAVHGGLTEIARPYAELSQKIMDQAFAFSMADDILTIPAGSIVPAACFRCITQEAKLKIMRMPDLNADDFDFGNKVRHVALMILINYRGPYSKQISAALLGLAEEYSYACGLLADEPSEDNDDMSDISEDIRRRLRELLLIIHDTFPFESAIDYDSIKHFRTVMGNTHTENLSEPGKEIVSASEVSYAKSDEVSFLKTPTPLPRDQRIMEVEATCEVSPDITSVHSKTPIPTKIVAPATPSSLNTASSAP